MKAKRTIASALALAMLTTAVASVSVSAASATVALTASKETVSAAGEEFNVTISIADIPSTKVNTLDFALTYDNTVLTISSVTAGKSASVDTSADTTVTADTPALGTSIHDSEIDISWTTGLGSDAWISEDGVLLTITGTVNAGVEEGTTSVIDFAPVTRETYEGSGESNGDILVGYIYGTDYAAYEVKTTAGSVTVGKAATTDVTTTAKPDTTTTASSTTTKETAATTTKSSGTGSTSTLLYGDINLDGRVDITDAVLLNKATAGAVDLNTQARSNADCNGDGNTDSADAVVLMKFLVNLVNSLPSES